jgi:filamentous hemagglutinin family protein
MHLLSNAAQGGLSSHSRWSRGGRHASSYVGGVFALSVLSQAMAQTQPPAPAALPTTPTVVAGQASMSTAGTTLTIKQTTDKLITNWAEFNISAGNTVSFEQPSAKAVALNRVKGTGNSKIDGTLTSNGRVFLVNPNGVIFGAGASVAVGSLVASTLDIKDDDFVRGSYRFSGSGGSVENNARILAGTASNDAYVALIGGAVTNTGALHAGQNGTVAMGAGADVTLDLGGPVRLRVNQGLADAVITHSGSAYAGGGQVVLSALGTSAMQAGVINQTGILNAENLAQGPGGSVLLTADGGTINASNELNASGRTGGGTIDLRANKLEIAGTLKADAQSGDGGQISLGATGDLQFKAAGVISASGDNGGFASLQSDGQLLVAGSIDAAGRGAGAGGIVGLEAGSALTLMKSAKVQSAHSLDSGGSITVIDAVLKVGSNGGLNEVAATQLGGWLDAGHDVQLRAQQDLTVDAAVTSTKRGELGLTAGRSVLLNASLDLGQSSVSVVANSQDADLKAGRGTGLGSVTMAQGTHLVSSGDVSLKVDGDAAGAQAGVITLARVEAGTLNLESVRMAATLEANNKVYDGTTAVTVKSLSTTGLDLTNSNLSLSNDLAFVNKQVGTAKSIEGRIAVKGFDTADPSRSAALRNRGDEVTVSGQADITPRKLTLSQLSAIDKVYDGQTTATGRIGADDRIAGDQLSLSWTAAFENKQVGTNKQVQFSNVILQGADAGNYTLDATGLATQASITKRMLTVSELTAQDRIYDGTTDATVAFAKDNRVAGDDLTLAAQGSFDNKRAGAGKRVTVTGLMLSGGDADNYEVTPVTTTTTASIAQRVLTLGTLSAQDRKYDGSTQAVVAFAGDDRLVGDTFRVMAAGQFDNPHAGINKRVSVTQLFLSGEDAANYHLEPALRETTANIFQRPLTLGQLTARNKVYDGQRDAQVFIGTDDRLAGDDLRISTTGHFDTKHAGTHKRVNVTSISLAGSNAGDYVVANPDLSTTADIERRVLSLSSLRALDKIYDGNTQAQVVYGRNDRLVGDDVQVAATGSFASKQAGTGKLVTVTNVALSGADAANYVPDYEGHTTRANIDTRLLSLNSLRAQDKIYDGNRDAEVAYGADDRVAGDDLRVSAIGSFDDRNVGVGKRVTVTDVKLSGGDAANYRVDAVGATTTASIDQRLLSLSDLVALDKVYDRTVEAQVSAGKDDRVKGDQLQVALTGQFDSRHAGRNKTVTVTGIQLSGDDAGNYRVTDQPLTTQASVTPRTLGVSITASDKVYDGQVDATVHFSDDRLSGDHLSLVGGRSQFADANAGKDKQVTASQWQLAGEDAGNYVLNAPLWHTRATITPRLLQITAPSPIPFDKFLRPQTIVIGHDALVTDTVQVVAQALKWGPAPGFTRAVTLSDLKIEGAAAGNYRLDVPGVTAAATVSAPLPLPGASGSLLCSAPSPSACGAGATRTPGSTASQALVIQAEGVRVPADRLQMGGE